MEIFKLIKNYFNKRYTLLLVIVVFLSYGQMLLMQPWEDDQGLFIKMANLEANVGYFGRGPLGEGAYKYTAVPFIPIYYLFGTNVYAYFGLIFILYILATLFVYKVYSKVFGETAGRITSFIFASGYIASDGIWRMTNGVATLVSFTLVSTFFYFYWRYYKTEKIRYYLWSLLFFFVSVQYFVVRDHYLIAIAIAFEVLFMAFKKFPRSLFYSLLRMIPTSFIFYYLVIAVGDSRSTGALGLVSAVLNGNFELTHGFFSSVANLVIPDYLTTSLSKYLNILGVLIILSFGWIIRKSSKNKKVVALFVFWILVNIMAYWIYTPSITYETVSRYLAHSFLPLTVLLGILYTEFGKWTKTVIIIFGILNICNSIVYQHKFLITKSFPTKAFYSDLKSLLPKIEKGDILYFDVSRNSETQYRAAISAAMLPNSGSFAWRYGIDRYDFTLVDDFSELKKLINEQKLDPGRIKSFWYTNGKLVETSDTLKSYFDGKKKSQNFNINLEGNSNSGLVIDLPATIDSSFPRTLEFTLIGKPDNLEQIKFTSKESDENLKKMSLIYVQEMSKFILNSKVSSNSFWQNNLGLNVLDDDLSTVWQSDRLEWQKRNDYLTVKLAYIQKINRITWVAGTYSGSIPISYKVDISTDGINWKTVKNITNQKINTLQELQVIEFDEVDASFVKFTVSDTLGGDSPMVAEFRVIPSSLKNLDLKRANKFLENPFEYITSIAEFNSTLTSFNYRFPAKLYWYGNKLNGWSTSKSTELNILFDGKPHKYKVLLPAGGTEIYKLQIADIKIPSIIKFLDVKVY